MVRSSDGAGECTQSGAVFSAHIMGELDRVFGTDMHPVPADPEAFTESSKISREASPSAWHCPRCAVGTIATSDGQRCPECDATLGPFIYELIELNPHP
ncbi:MAG: hypothetical protein AAF488_02580 [Planctomycetota bacterium]